MRGSRERERRRDKEEGKERRKGKERNRREREKETCLAVDYVLPEPLVLLRIHFETEHIEEVLLKREEVSEGVIAKKQTAKKETEKGARYQEKSTIKRKQRERDIERRPWSEWR